MSLWTWAGIILISVAVMAAVAVAVGRYLMSRASFPTLLDSEPTPCYRCGVNSNSDYMGLRYCTMCRIMVMQMLPGVRHDPPFGFPGSTGYLEFPEQEKKEESRG